MELPDYREQSPEVRERFQRITNRPVKLKVNGLYKHFRTGQQETCVLENIHLNIHHREFVSVIGPSGCGKSTLIRILAGLEFLTGGEFLLDGNKVTGPSADRGMVFQGYTLFPWLSVKRNIMFGLEVNGRSGPSVEQEARQWINLIGLSGFENAYPDQLSGGMKQRVAIARSLANNPDMLFMDEPFGALDAQTRSQMQSHLIQIWKNVDVTILFVTHDLDEAVFLSDRIIVLAPNPGRVEEIIEVPVPRPRNVDQLISPTFLSVRQHIESLIHKYRKTSEETLPMVKFTKDDPDVD
mgnify:CR=1 FL=1